MQRLLRQLPKKLRQLSIDGVEAPCRSFASKLPDEYRKYYESTEQPVRRLVAPILQTVNPTAAAPEAVATGLGVSQEDSRAELQRQGASTVTSWMFPWEKRQLDSKAGPLKTWEKYYWGVFVGAIALFLFNRLPGKEKEATDPEAERLKEERKLKAARLLLAGQNMASDDDDDEFEGLSPQEIQEYVDKTLGRGAASDPFEGLSPEEINDMLATSQQKQLSS